MLFSLRLQANKTLRRYSMFLAGLILLQPLFLGINAPYFTIQRFKISASKVDLFIVKMNNSIQLCYFVGSLFAALYNYFAPYFIQKYNNLISVGANWSTVVCSILLLFSYVVKGEEGSLTFFYYMLSLSSLIFSINQGFVMSIAMQEIPCYASGITLSGVKVVAYQVVFLYFAEKFEVKNIPLYIVSVQIAIAIFLTVMTSVLWTTTFFTVENDPLLPISFEVRESSFLSDLWKSRWPLLMTSLGLGWVYFCYPQIVPYKLTEIRAAYRIDIFYVFVSGILALVFCFFSEFTDLGPNKNWRLSRSKWVYTFFLLIPYLSLPILFLLPLHYPDFRLSNLIKTQKYFMAFLGLLYIMSHLVLTNVGYSAASMQTDVQYSPVMTTFNVLFAYFVMVVVILLTQGYLRFYNICSLDPENWPTLGMSWFSAFFFWVGRAFSHGWKGFVTTFSTNIKRDILEII